MSKYHAQPTRVNGIRFDSKKEAERYEQLLLLERVGQITGLELHPRYALYALAQDGTVTKVADYIPDFRYVENGRTVVEDVKGVRTPVYRLKKRWMLAQYGITILET